LEKVVFVEDESDEENADSEGDHLEVVGKTKESHRCCALFWRFDGIIPCLCGNSDCN